MFFPYIISIMYFRIGKSHVMYFPFGGGGEHKFAFPPQRQFFPVTLPNYAIRCYCSSPFELFNPVLFMYLQNAAKRRQTRLLKVLQAQEESKREYYEEMIRQAKITASAQSDDSDMVGRFTTGSGYSEMLALRDIETPQGWSDYYKTKSFSQMMNAVLV